MEFYLPGLSDERAVYLLALSDEREMYLSAAAAKERCSFTCWRRRFIFVLELFGKVGSSSRGTYLV
jgi:hypothetical protein